MNWKIIGLLIFVPLIIVTSILVWNNRASDRLVSSFISVIFLGLSGLLITALVSLKEEKKKKRFPAVMFLERNPFSIASYKYRINKGRMTPIIMTNNAIKNLQNKKEKYVSLDSVPKDNYWKVMDDLFQRYIFDFLDTRYRTHWYNESIEIKGPSRLSNSARSIDSDIKFKRIKWSELNSIFTGNDFFEIGYYINKDGSKMSSEISVPLGTTIEKKDILNGFEIIFDNKFVTLSIACEHRFPDKNMNKEVQTAYRMNEINKENFTFQPYIIDFELNKKKFRSGHPDMPKYEYWADDIISFLERNISVDEFWRVVELNN